MNSATPSGTAGLPTGQTVLSLTHHLHSTLRSTFAPLLRHPSPAQPLLHPLADLPDAEPTRELVHATLAHLRAACSTLSRQLDAAQDRPRHQVDKVLALLKETAGSEAVLRSHKEDVLRANDALALRATYPAQVPVLSPELLQPLDRPSQSLAILQSIGTAVGLASFTEQSSATGVHTLSLGGKVMVVDLDVDGTSGAVLKTRFTYDLHDAQHDDDDNLVALLSRNLIDLDRAADPDHEQALENRLRAFRDVLTELKKLDEMTEEIQRDCFALVRGLSASLALALPTEGTSLPLLLPAVRNTFPSLLYHVSASALLSAPSAPLSTHPSASTVRISLAKPNAVDPASFVATLDPPVPISAQVGRRVLNALGASHETEDLPRSAKRTRSSAIPFEDLLRPPSDPAETYTVTFDDVAVPLAFTLAPSSHSGYLCTTLRFSDPNQLLAALSVLNDQLLLNDLVHSILRPEYLPAPLPPRSKRRKTETPTLAELFESPATSLPVAIHISASRLTLTLPNPLLPPAETVPFSIEITAVKGKYEVHLASPSLSSTGEEEEKMRKVLDVSRDLTLLVRWFWKHLERRRMDES